MPCTQPRRTPQPDQYALAYDRRRRAAWFDYLQTTREAPRSQYHEIERAAWARLQRRLERNDQRFPQQPQQYARR